LTFFIESKTLQLPKPQSQSAKAVQLLDQDEGKALGSDEAAEDFP
jgi:hypothetical protein